MIEIMDKSSPTKENKDTNNNSNKSPSHNSRIAEKYGLRPRTIIKRIQLEKSRQETHGKESRKPKPPPLSKYRRKTANARERHRMKEINEAFATLRGILPSFNARRSSTSGMTKITTLKLATSYIQALSDVLSDVKKSSVDIHHHHHHTLHNTHSVSLTHPHSKGGEVLKGEEKADIFAFHPSRTSSIGNHDISDLLSDDSCVFENKFDAFDDIPALAEPDPFALLLAADNADIL